MTETVEELEAKLRRARATAKRAETSEARRRATGFTKGQAVLTDCPRSSVYHHRKGVVVTCTELGEVGVSFTRTTEQVAAWFLPSELIKL